MKEQVSRFGQWASLVGVLTEPDTEDRGLPTVLFLNAGLLHRVGPHRLHVNLARRLSRLGYRSFRFDVSGVGDSAPRKDSMSRLDSLVSETIEAMDYLAQRHGARRFVLFGICSGADQAARVAEVDPRVVGYALIDGYRFRTRGFMLHHYRQRLFNLDSYLSVLTGKHPAVKRLLGGLTGGSRNGGGANANGDDAAPPTSIMAGFVPFPSQLKSEAMLHGFVERGGQLCAVYTVSPQFNHRNQFFEMFPKMNHHPRVRVEYFPRADHLFTTLRSREELMNAIESWVQSVEWAESTAHAEASGSAGSAT